MKTSVGFILMFLFIAFQSFSQNEIPDAKTLQAFYKTKTAFVLYKDSLEGYDDAIKWIAQKTWRATPYELITAEKFEAEKRNPRYSFITIECIPVKIKDKVMKVDHIVLSLANKDKKSNDLIKIFQFPIAYEQKKNKSYYMLPAFLLFIQTYLDYISTHTEIKTFSDYMNVCNNYVTEIGDKELWLLPKDIDPEYNTEEKIQAFYEGEVKFATEGELQENIRKQALDFVFVHRISPNNPTYEGVCMIYIFGADGACYFFQEFVNDEKRPCYLRQEHFKKFKNK